MMKKLSLTLASLLVCFTASAEEHIKIIQMPIKFGQKRIALTKQYLHTHYGINQNNIQIKPRMIVLHATEIPTFKQTFQAFYPATFPSKQDRPYIDQFSKLNVSAQFVVDKDGTIYQLMPDNWMARHTIGLNYLAIGIENVGFEKNLTKAQVNADAYLVRYLKKKYPAIKYLIGHYEYGHFRNSTLWKERNPKYFTYKTDPGPSFMRAVRERVKDLHLLPKKTYPLPEKTQRK